MTRQEILESVEAHIRRIMFEDAMNGAEGFAYVRVSPDGSVYSGRGPSPCFSEGEYYGKGEHEVTVWSSYGFRDSQTGEDGIFEWTAIDVPLNDGERIERAYIYDSAGDPVEAVADRVGVECWELDDQWYTTGEYLQDEFDLDWLLSTIDDDLNFFSWLPSN